MIAAGGETPNDQRARGHRANSAAILVVSGETLTFGELEQRSCQLARLFRDNGLKAGDRVTILMESRLEWFIAMWAAWRSALFFVPVNWHPKPAEARYVVANSDARAIITSERLIDLAAQIADGYEPVPLCLTTGPAERGFVSLQTAITGYPGTPLEDEREGGSMPYSPAPRASRRAYCAP